MYLMEQKKGMLMIRVSLTLILLLITNVYALDDCKWNNQEGIPCIVVSKTNNTSLI